MPYYSRYRRRTGFARYRRRYSGYRRRYYRRRTSTGGSLSSRSRLRIRVPAQRVVTLTIPSESTDSDVATANPFFEQLNDRPQCVCSAVGMPLYQAYTGLFDQVKCDGVITKVAVVSPIGAGASLQALQLLIAYDRQGTINETINSPAAVTVSSLYNMSSVQIRSAINNSVAKTARSCWASDIQERTVFHDCTIAVTQDKKVIYDQDYNSDRQVAAYFVPLTYIGIRNAAAAATSSTSIQILIEQVYYFTFRNPKFGAAPATGGGTRALAVRAEDDPLATESLDDAPQALVDMAVRAADATGTLVRTHGRSGLTPQLRKHVYSMKLTVLMLMPVIVGLALKSLMLIFSHAMVILLLPPLIPSLNVNVWTRWQRPLHNALLLLPRFVNKLLRWMKKMLSHTLTLSLLMSKFNN